jgi:hypothetical protein
MMEPESGTQPRPDDDDVELELDDSIPDARKLAAEAALASGGPAPGAANYRVSLSCGACGAKQSVQTLAANGVTKPAMGGGPIRRESQSTTKGAMYGWLSVLAVGASVVISLGAGPLIFVFGWMQGMLLLVGLILGIKAMVHIDIEYKWRPFLAGAGVGLALTSLLWAMP